MPEQRILVRGPGLRGPQGIPGPEGPAGGGASTLDALTDVVVPSPTTGQYLQFDGTNWVNAAGASPTSLDNLSDVTTSGAATGTVLRKSAGDWTAQTLNADIVPDGTTNKAYTATEKTKLSGIATSATANSSDATLLARANHTGTVPLATQASDWAATTPTNGQIPTFNTGTGKWTPTTPTTSGGDALRSGSIKQFADVDDSSPASDNVLVWDTVSGTYVPRDLSLNYAEVGGDGRLVSSANPQFYIPACIVNAGNNPPAGFPINGIVFEEPAVASIIPLNIGTGQASGPAACTVTTTDAVASGDYLIITIGTSGEVTLPSTYTITYSAGAAAATSAIESHSTGTAQANILYAKCTSAIAAGSTITVTANQTRAQIMASVAKAQNLAASSVLDQTAATNSNSSTTLAWTIGPTGATTQAAELGIMAIAFNEGGTAATRTIAGQNGWSAVGPQIDTSTGSATRSLATFYKVLSATGTVSGDALWTTTDGSTGGRAGAVATFKAV